VCKGVCYIGFTDEVVENDFKWLDESAVSYTNWFEREPNNYHNEDAVELHHNKWNDRDTSGKLPPVCKVKKAPTKCWKNFCYFKGSPMKWVEAKSYCELLGGHLTSIHSKEENDVVANVCKGVCYIGLSDEVVENNFMWLDGSAVSYTNWFEREPNNHHNEDAVELHHHKWNDRDTSGKLPPVCKVVQYPPTKCYKNFCYFKGSAMKWVDAKSYCKLMGGHLTSIHSKTENDVVASVCKGVCYIGFTDEVVENDFKWLDGSAVSYTNWFEREPNNYHNEDAVELHHHKWNDRDRSGKLPPVCKVSKRLVERI